jgi:hypothetical protein
LPPLPRLRNARFSGSLLLFLATWLLGAAAPSAFALAAPPLTAQFSGSTTSSSAHPRTLADYGKLPLRFEANAGQTDPRVRFVSHGPGYTLFLTSRQAVLSLSRPGGKAGPNDGERTSWDAVRLEFVGANRQPAISPQDELTTRSNYFIGDDPAKWRTNVPNYGRVRYGGIYPGIDLVYYGNQQQLEHDFVVAPGADPTRIAFTVHGAKHLRLDAAGDLAMETGGGPLRLLKPVIYQEIDGKRQQVAGSYVLRAGNRVGFQLQAFDRNQPLVIDPVLSYSTYLSYYLDGTAYSIAVDSSGYAYISGWTTSAIFPLVNPVQNSLQGGESVFVSKLSADGCSLVYSTYLGGGPAGTTNSAQTGIAVDAAGSAYVTGTTTSASFPTVNAYQGALHGTASAFITKFSPDGSSLVYSTYLGGSANGSSAGSTTVGGIAVDSSGSAYVTGTTNATNFPTRNAFQSDCPLIEGYDDPAGSPVCSGFVSKLSSDGSSLVYSTYLHGLVLSNPGWYTTTVTPAAIAVDSGGSAYVTGSTTAPLLPGTQNGFQSSCAIQQGFEDPWTSCFQYGFVSKLSADGSSLVYSTYLGGSNFGNSGMTGNAGAGIAVNAQGDAYVAGSTYASDFPTTPKAFQPSTTASETAFVSKLNADGSALVYSTYLGGSVVGYGTPATSAAAIAVDSNGSAYVTGNTNASNFPTVNPIQGNTGVAGYITEFSADGTSLVYSSYLGNASIYGIAVDAMGDAYVTGSAGATGFPTTPNTLQPNSAGGGIFITKIASAQSTSILSWQPPAGVIVYGTTLAGILNAQATSSGSAVAGTFAYTANAPGGSAVTVTSSSVLDVGIYTLTAAFTPSDPSLYSIPANVSVTLQVDPEAPSISPGAGSYTTVQPVTLADATPGAIVYYTTDGSTPTLSSTQCYSPCAIAVSQTETLQAIAVTGVQTPIGYQMLASPVASAAYTITLPAATPYFSVAPGTYTSAQTVYLYDSTPGATIYYTTDGSTPTTSSTVYTGYPLYAGVSQTISAIAAGGGYTQSAVGALALTITPLLPVFSLPNGIYPAAQQVTISDAVAGAQIYYTTDGSAPTVNSTLYSGPITVASTEAVQAIAVSPDGTSPSSAAAAYYLIGGSNTTYIDYPANGFTSANLALNLANNSACDVVIPAGQSTGLLQLTNSFNYEVCSAWFNTQVPVQGFVNEFTFQLLAPATADGITFAVQGSGLTALGAYGEGLAYWNIPSSVAVKFDTWNNYGEGIDSTGLYLDGAEPAMPAVDLTTSGINLHSGDLMDAFMVYDGANLKMVVTDTVTKASVFESFPIVLNQTPTDIPTVVGGNNAWVGFTGATGGANSTQNIVSWNYSGLPNPPAPAPTIGPAAGSYPAGQAVTLSDSVAGATIYYTIDGSTPTVNSSVYSAPLTLTVAETVTAIAQAPGYYLSPASSATYGILPPAATPTFSLKAGVYGATEKLTISDTTPGATIYYTTNGSAPTTSSAVYGGPIVVGATETISAMAIASGYSQSPVNAESFTITVVAPPFFSQNGGTFNAPQTLGINDATPGATIYCTTDGSTPTVNSQQCSSPMTINASETVKAIATAPGFKNPSAVTSTTFTLQTPAPMFEPPAGTYTSIQTVQLLGYADPCGSGANCYIDDSIYYTTNGSTPTTASTPYTGGAITVSSSETLKAIAVLPGWSNSTVASAAYTINLPQAATPTFTLATGTYYAAQTVSINDATPNVSIYYTVDGSTPTASSMLYAGGTIAVSTSETLKAIAVLYNYRNSAVATAAYKLLTPSPTSSLKSGRYTTPETIALSDALSGASIYYTTDGSTPTVSSALLYTAPIVLNSDTTFTLKTIAVAPGFQSSGESIYSYTIDLISMAPAFSPAPGVYGLAQIVTLSSTTPNAQIYFTTDGTTPTTASDLYANPIPVSDTQTIRAIAVTAGYANSVSTAKYVLVGSAQVLTGVATSMAAPVATLNASANSFGVAGQAWFLWGSSSSALNSTTPTIQLPATNGVQSISAPLDGLTTGTTYYFQPVVSTLGGTSYGAIQSFVAN